MWKTIGCINNISVKYIMRKANKLMKTNKLRKTNKLMKTNKLRKTQRGGWVEEDENLGRLTLMQKIDNLKELLSEIHVRNGQYIKGLQKTNTLITTFSVKRLVTNKYNDEWFTKNFIEFRTGGSQLDDYYNFILREQTEAIKMFEEKVASVKAIEREIEEGSLYGAKHNNDLWFARQYPASIKKSFERFRNFTLCTPLVKYLKQLYIIITGNPANFTTNGLVTQTFTCDTEIPELPYPSTQHRDILINIFGKDVMYKFIENYNGIKKRFKYMFRRIKDLAKQQRDAVKEGIAEQSIIRDQAVLNTHKKLPKGLQDLVESNLETPEITKKRFAEEQKRIAEEQKRIAEEQKRIAENKQIGEEDPLTQEAKKKEEENTEETKEEETAEETAEETKEEEGETENKPAGGRRRHQTKKRNKRNKSNKK